VPEIDGLRCVAVCSVVLYHLGGFLGWRIAEHGYRGVNLFYVISGFILGLPFASHYLQQKPPVKLRSYFLRRLARLEPPYLLSLLICFGGLVWLQGRDGRELLPGLAASAGYVHSLWFGAQSAINPVTWSLEVEVQFYCLAPLLAGIFALRPKRLRRAVLLALVILAGSVQLYPHRAQYSVCDSVFPGGFSARGRLPGGLEGKTNATLDLGLSSIRGLAATFRAGRQAGVGGFPDFGSCAICSETLW
jgi:peptidoglycan/LPS O-acetylase OafA/YrhL